MDEDIIRKMNDPKWVKKTYRLMDRNLARQIKQLRRLRKELYLDHYDEKGRPVYGNRKRG